MEDRLRIWMGDKEPTLEGYIWVQEATVLAVCEHIESLAIDNRCGSMEGCDFIALIKDVGARLSTLLIYEENEKDRMGMVGAAVELGVADNVLISEDGGYSFMPVK